MKSFVLRASWALLGAFALISMGCQEDNEAAIKQQATTSAGAEVKGAIPQPKSANERAQQYQSQKPNPKGMGYPGAR